MSRPTSFPPLYTDAFQQASENLRLALPLVNKHKTPINPVNYAVWYEYVAGHNTALIEEIDQRLSQNAPVTADLIQQLFEKYVLMNMPERISQTNEGLKLVVDNTISKISKAEQSADSCSQSLNQSQSKLAACHDSDDLKTLIDVILADTEKLAQTSVELKQELKRSSQQIEQLRAELKALKQSARTDSLTGLLNRGSLNKELGSLCKEGASNHALILFDIDHFKKINDSFGHLIGDKVLQYFASVLLQHCNAHRVAARFGGEEMAMLIKHCDIQTVTDTADIIRMTLANSRLKKKDDDGTIGQVTVSAGITMIRAGDTPSKVIDRADQALYQSKAQGRNRINLL